MPNDFEFFLEKAKTFVGAEVASLNLAVYFLQKESMFKLLLTEERAKKAEAVAEERAMKAEAVAEERAKTAEERAKTAEERAKTAEERAKTAEERVKSAVAEGRANAAEQLLQVKTDFFFKIEAQRNITFQAINMDRLRGRGLLSSRGIYEWYLKLVYDEHRGKFAKYFKASDVCNKLGPLNSGLSF